MLFVIIIAIGFIAWISISTINGWNSDPLGNRKEYHRPKNAQFKSYYGVTKSQAIDEFEHKMATGMFCEDREIYVTAFCRDAQVERVTASMGSDRRCSNSDKINEWTNHVKRLNCNEIRQYHNHPNCLGRKILSNRDMASHQQLSEYLDNYGIMFRSFLVYANYFKGWVIKEYGNANKPFQGTRVKARR